MPSPEKDKGKGPYIDPGVTRTPKGAFEYRKGKWIPLWAILFLPFIFIFQFLHRTIKQEINWWAVLWTTLVFELIFVPMEYYHLSRGHWVYNEQRILGPKVFGLPIEGPLIYCLFSPLVIIAVFHFVRIKLAKKSAGGQP